MLRGQNRKSCFFLNQLIKNLKLHNISKNQVPGSIKRGGIRDFPHFDLKKNCSSQSSHQIEPKSWKFGCKFSTGLSSYLSALLHIRTVQKSGFSVGFPNFLSLFLAELPSKLSWEAEIWYVHLVSTLDVPFVDLNILAYFTLSQPRICGFLVIFSHVLSLFLA